MRDEEHVGDLVIINKRNSGGKEAGMLGKVLANPGSNLSTSLTIADAVVLMIHLICTVLFCS